MMEQDSKTGFKSSNDFCLYLEQIKTEQDFETYLETVIWYAENESDLDMDQLVRHLNKKIRDGIEYEARVMNLLKDRDDLISLF